jgi:dynein heavy chain
VCFSAEDPEMYAGRFAAAQAGRAAAEAALRYNLYVDCMPTEDIPVLTIEQACCITDMVALLY